MVVFCLLGYADVLRESKYERVIQWHARKVGMFVRGEWPRPLPEIIFLGEESEDGALPE